MSMTATTNEDSRERFRAIWRTMKARCDNPNNKSYKHYGARRVS